MRFKKTIFISFIILITFLTYLFFSNEKLNYVALGDSLAAGQSPYGEIGYGYTDYIADYLKKKNSLQDYIQEYAVSGYQTKDILEDLEDNKKVIVHNHEYNLKSLLRESDIVTISIGANDFLKGLTLETLDLENIDIYLKKIDTIMLDVKQVLTEIRKYAKNQVIVVGYYNPFPRLTDSYQETLDKIFEHADALYYGICEDLEIEYVSIYGMFKRHSEYLPNPLDIHPNIVGYQAIGEEIVKNYLK